MLVVLDEIWFNANDDSDEAVGSSIGIQRGMDW